MQGYNCIMVYKDEQRKELLFCKRKKDPYKGKFNLVGGKSSREKTDLTRLTGSWRKKRESPEKKSVCAI